jgi:dTMP kinase
MDALSLAFHRRVREGYQALIAADPARWVSVSAADDPDTIHARIRAAVMARLASKT